MEFIRYGGIALILGGAFMILGRRTNLRYKTTFIILGAITLIAAAVFCLLNND